MIVTFFVKTEDILKKVSVTYNGISANSLLEKELARPEIT
jgi:hypothetical protein